MEKKKKSLSAALWSVYFHFREGFQKWYDVDMLGLSVLYLQ